MPDFPPSPPDLAARLAELRRQREAVARHLEWLDRELAAAGGSPPVAGAAPAVPLAPNPPVAAPPAVAAPVPGASGTSAPFSPDAILSREATGLSSRDKLGCILIVGALALFILSIFWVLPYFLHSSEAMPEPGAGTPTPAAASATTPK